MSFTVLFVSLVAVVSLMGIIAVWSPRDGLVKTLAVALVGATAVLGGMAYADLLSRPKPVAWELLAGSDSQVLAGHIIENEAIYVWLLDPGSTEPRYLVLPWRQGDAEDLQEALHKGSQDGVAVMMGYPQERSLESRDAPLFYALPQPKLPDKTIYVPQQYQPESE